MSTTGKVVQVIGPVVDIEFPLDEKLPEINTALKIQEADDKTLTVEVALELGDGVVRTIAMDGTDGLKRGCPLRTFRKCTEPLKGRTESSAPYEEQCVLSGGKKLDRLSPGQRPGLLWDLEEGSAI